MNRRPIKSAMTRNRSLLVSMVSLLSVAVVVVGAGAGSAQSLTGTPPPPLPSQSEWSVLLPGVSLNSILDKKEITWSNGDTDVVVVANETSYVSQPAWSTTRAVTLEEVVLRSTPQSRPWEDVTHLALQAEAGVGFRSVAQWVVVRRMSSALVGMTYVEDWTGSGPITGVTVLSVSQNQALHVPLRRSDLLNAELQANATSLQMSSDDCSDGHYAFSISQKGSVSANYLTCAQWMQSLPGIHVEFSLSSNTAGLTSPTPVVTLHVGSTIVFVPRRGYTATQSDRGNIYIFTNASTGGPVFIDRDHLLYGRWAYQFRAVGSYDFVILWSTKKQLTIRVHVVE